MEGPGRDEGVVAGLHGARLALEDRIPLALHEEEDLVTLVGLLADLPAGQDGHRDELRMLARFEHPAEVVVPARELDVVPRRHPWKLRRLPSVVPTMAESPVRELRVAVTVEDYEEALRFYRDALGLPVIEDWASETGSGAVLDAGRATLELLSADQTDLVDEVEVGRRGVSGPVRLALEVEDSSATGEELVAAGAERLSQPVLTPWLHRNVRLRAPDGMQLTLFTVVDE